MTPLRLGDNKTMQAVKRLVRGILQKAGFEARRIKSAPISVRHATERVSMDIIDQVFNFYISVSPFYDETIPPPLRIAGAWKPDLMTRRKTQINLISTRDKAGYRELSERMFFNELVCGLWDYGYWGELRSVPNRFDLDVERFQLVTGRDAGELVTNNLWSMWGLQVAGGIVRPTDPWHGLQAFNILNLLGALPEDRGKRTVIDLGSGYGGMAEKLAVW